MKQKLLLFFVASFFLACTSNTIYKKPKDLIPRDSMVLLIKEMFIASNAKSIKNIALQRRISYIPLIFKKYALDSTRFKSSNFYYTSKNDQYKAMLQEVLDELKKEQTKYSLIKKERDSIIKDSIATRIRLQKRSKKN